ncbi:MAG: carboxypeptidase-like regulatory domain-containing protein, partial [Salinivirgaceae bacterium]
MKNLIHYTFLIALLSMPFVVNAQQITISGQVTDFEDNVAFPGVTVVIPGTTIGTVTDFDGKYSISVPTETKLLQFSFIGMKTATIEIGEQRIIDVALEPEISKLDEVVVIGYGTVKKSDLTGAVGSVKAKDLVKITSLNPEQSLQGKVSGVQVTSTSGAPGAV